MLDWKPEDLSPRSSGGILRHVIKKPISRKTPNDSASVTGMNHKNLYKNLILKILISGLFSYDAVHLVGNYESRTFDDRELTFSIGEVSDDEVISGVQKALTHFGKGETSRLVTHKKLSIRITLILQ